MLASFPTTPVFAQWGCEPHPGDRVKIIESLQYAIDFT